MAGRAAFYIDGFNVYHAIDDLNQPHLKWLNWWRLAEILIPSVSETVAKVVFCTALKTSEPNKLIRQRRYINALEQHGVVCLKGHFASEDRGCRRCGHQWSAPVEKQGDVNLALHLIADAYNDLFDHCYLVTADSDQAATSQMLKANFPNKKLTSLVITGRSHSKHILSYADAKITINVGHLERALFPKFIPGANAILRPTEYDPPVG